MLFDFSGAIDSQSFFWVWIQQSIDDIICSIGNAILFIANRRKLNVSLSDILKDFVYCFGVKGRKWNEQFIDDAPETPSINALFVLERSIQYYFGSDIIGSANYFLSPSLLIFLRGTVIQASFSCARLLSNRMLFAQRMLDA